MKVLSTPRCSEIGTTLSVDSLETSGTGGTTKFDRLSVFRKPELHSSYGAPTKKQSSETTFNSKGELS